MVDTDKASVAEGVNSFFEKAADYLKLDGGIRELLRRPWRELTVALPVRMDDGTIRVFSGYRVQHNGARGPYKGATVLKVKRNGRRLSESGRTRGSDA